MPRRRVRKEPTGQREEIVQVGELDDDGLCGLERVGEERLRRGGPTASGGGARQRRTVEAPRARLEEPALGQAALVVAVERVRGLERVAQLGTVLGRHRPDDRVEQLGGHHRTRHLLPRPDVVAVADDDQVVTRGEDGFEQRLAHLAPWVGITEAGGGGHQIVAGVGGRAERRLVDPEQAHHPEGNPAERGQRRAHDPAAEEVGPCHDVGHPVVDQPAQVGELELER